MTKPEFETLVKAIVNRHLPDERVAFDVGAEQVISDLFAGRPVDQPTRPPEFGFGYGDIKAGLEFIVLLRATFEALRFLRDLIRKRSVQRAEIEAEWKAKLQSEGMAEGKASAIATEHADDLLAALKA